MSKPTEAIYWKLDLDWVYVDPQPTGRYKEITVDGVVNMYIEISYRSRRNVYGSIRILILWMVLWKRYPLHYLIWNFLTI